MSDKDPVDIVHAILDSYPLGADQAEADLMRLGVDPGVVIRAKNAHLVRLVEAADKMRAALGYDTEGTEDV